MELALKSHLHLFPSSEISNGAISIFFHLSKYPIEPSPSFSIFSTSCVRCFHLFDGRIPQGCIFWREKDQVCSSRRYKNRAGKKQTLVIWTQRLRDRRRWCLSRRGPTAICSRYTQEGGKEYPFRRYSPARLLLPQFRPSEHARKRCLHRVPDQLKRRSQWSPSTANRKPGCGILGAVDRRSLHVRAEAIHLRTRQVVVGGLLFCCQCATSM